MESEKKGKNKRKIIIIAIIIILLLLILIKLYFEFKAERERLEVLKKEQVEQLEQLERQNMRSIIDSLCNLYSGACDEFEKSANVGSLMIYADSLYKRQEFISLTDSLCRVDDVNCEKYKQFSNIDELRKFLESGELRKSREKKTIDSLENEKLRKSREKKIADGINRENARAGFIADSISGVGERICKDTVAPWVYPEPTGGVYFEPIKVSFIVSEQCSVFYKRSKDAEYKLYDGETISISQDGELYYYAADSCGNMFEEQKKVYDFRQKQSENICPEGMTFVESDRGNFCIDRYAWENKKGVRPRNNISWQEARDSCLSVKKRLCTSDEWTVSCKGPYNWKYPYGEKYIRRACITQDTTYQRNGFAGECRGWYAIYDMVGNLSEWTSTRAPENNRFFIVKGGFWNSGHVADCDMSRYSYYPQNRHNQVGFRCCKDITE